MDKKLKEELTKYYDKANMIGLCDHVMFGDTINLFVETNKMKSRLFDAIHGICGSYTTSARDFVKLISYDDFKKWEGVTKVMALGLRLFILYQCGVDWLAVDKMKDSNINSKTKKDYGTMDCERQ